MKVRVRDYDLAFDDTGGPGTPLLLLHGFPLDRTQWMPQIHALAPAARVITPDLRGMGESGRPAGPVSIETYAQDACALLDALAIQKAVVGGLSMGGYIAFAFYRLFAPRVRALVLADTRPQPDSAEAKKGRDENAALARAQGAGAIADKMLPRMLTPQTLQTRPEVAERVRALMAGQPVEGIVAALLAMRDRPDSTPRLAEIDVPTLVLVGAEDTLTTPQDAAALSHSIRNARLTTIPGAAHLSNYEQPELFNRAVVEFLTALG